MNELKDRNEKEREIGGVRIGSADLTIAAAGLLV